MNKSYYQILIENVRRRYQWKKGIHKGQYALCRNIRNYKARASIDPNGSLRVHYYDDVVFECAPDNSFTIFRSKYCFKWPSYMVRLINEFMPRNIVLRYGMVYGIRQPYIEVGDKKICGIDENITMVYDDHTNQWTPKNGVSIKKKVINRKLINDTLNNSDEFELVRSVLSAMPMRINTLSRIKPSEILFSDGYSMFRRRYSYVNKGTGITDLVRKAVLLLKKDNVHEAMLYFYMVAVSLHNTSIIGNIPPHAKYMYDDSPVSDLVWSKETEKAVRKSLRYLMATDPNITDIATTELVSIQDVDQQMEDVRA